MKVLLTPCLNIPNLKKLYDKHLSRFNQLQDPIDEEEHRLTREYCIKTFFLFLVGVTIFANTGNKHISVIWLQRDAKFVQGA